MSYDHLIGRQFDMGRYDCFENVIDFYKAEFGISITRYARPTDWDADKLDIIGMTYEAEGFFKLEDWTLKNLNYGDLLCMAIGSHKANHLAVYVGDNKILHHKVASFSSEEMLRDFWRKSICYVLRHKNVPIVTTEKPTISVMDILNERNALSPTS